MSALDALFDSYFFDAKRAAMDIIPFSPRQPSRGRTFTEREAEIALLVACGLTNREIAGQIGISANTVASHLHSIFTKFRLKRRSQLAALVGFGYAKHQDGWRDIQHG